VCPSSIEPYRYLSALTDAEMTRRASERLRLLLIDAREPGELRLFGALWAVEFRLRPKSEEEATKQQVKEDLKRLMPFETDPPIRNVIASGAQLIGDTALAARMGIRLRDPAHQVMDASNAWHKAHPRPKSDYPVEQKHGDGGDLLARSAEWLKMAPDSVISLSAGNWIAALARDYLAGGVLLDRIPMLIREVFENVDDPEAVIETDLAPSQLPAINRAEAVMEHSSAAVTLSEAYEKQGRTGPARETLQQLADYLASKTSPLGENDPQILQNYAGARYTYWRRRGEFAEHENRKLDALSAYRQALSEWQIGREELLGRQRALWKDLGGSDEAWVEWIAAIPDPSLHTAAPLGVAEGNPVGRVFPPFSARDVAGNVWTLDRLKGKTTIAVVWATWCAPCRAELPYFAKLADRLKGRDDVLAISLNADENFGLVEPFMKDHSYTFPALSAKQYTEDLVKYFSIPRTWIIKNGVIAVEYEGFGRDGEKWVDDMLARLK
jgi:thiol-disulfide isomerase/thioredoxin